MEAKKVFENRMGMEALSVTLLTGGVTNSSYAVETIDGKYILRIPGAGTNEYINRAWEIGNMREASVLGFLPEICCASVEDGIIISRYIENNIPMERADLGDAHRLELMCRRLMELHESGLQLVNEFDILGMKAQYETILEGMETELPEALREHRPDLEDAMDRLFTTYPKELVPCHGDPKLNNFLLQGERMWMIDWEYSGMADLYFDLVNMVMTNNLSDEEEQQLLRMYEHCSGIALKREKYILYKVATDYLWIYWHLIKLFQNEMAEYNEKSWKNRLSRALRNMKLLEETG